MCTLSGYVSVLLVAGGLAACDADLATPDAGPPTVEIGTGESSFESVVEEQELILVTGDQGGFHFLAHARIREVPAGDATMPGLLDNPVTRFSMFQEDGRQIDSMGPPDRLGYLEAEEGWYELPSARILRVDQTLVDDEGIVPTIYGERIRIRVELTDSEGNELSSERWVVPLLDPDS